nr:tripartite tricarboxylate transporter substrate-binding protein [Achromobacter ruhlandii]
MLWGAQARAADRFPDRPVRLIVPQSAGSGGDVVARLLGERIGASLGQPVVIENRPGANGIIAASSTGPRAFHTRHGFLLLQAPTYRRVPETSVPPSRCPYGHIPNLQAWAVAPVQ